MKPQKFPFSCIPADKLQQFLQQLTMHIMPPFSSIIIVQFHLYVKESDRICICLQFAKVYAIFVFIPTLWKLSSLIQKFCNPVIESGIHVYNCLLHRSTAPMTIIFKTVQ